MDVKDSFGKIRTAVDGEEIRDALQALECERAIRLDDVTDQANRFVPNDRLTCTIGFEVCRIQIQHQLPPAGLCLTANVEGGRSGFQREVLVSVERVGKHLHQRRQIQFPVHLKVGRRHGCSGGKLVDLIQIKTPVRI